MGSTVFSVIFSAVSLGCLLQLISFVVMPTSDPSGVSWAVQHDQHFMKLAYNERPWPIFATA